MNDQNTPPMSPEPAGFAGWFSIWIGAVTRPSEQYYSTLSEQPDAQTNNRAFIWVFLAGTVAAIITGILNAILELAGFAPQIPGFSELTGSAPRGSMATLGIALCTSPISGAISVLFFAIFVGIIQWVAKMFKGIGNFQQLAYVMAAISVPVSLVTSLLTPFTTIGVVGYCFIAVSLLISLYVMYLQVLAVKAVNKFGWGEAAGSYFLPLILFVCLCACLAFGIASIFGIAYSELLNQGFTP
jgi:hypothetical protein